MELSILHENENTIDRLETAFAQYGILFGIQVDYYADTIGKCKNNEEPV